MFRGGRVDRPEKELRLAGKETEERGPEIAKPFARIHGRTLQEVDPEAGSR